MERLIVGLGNPGPEYEDTRHNLGFRVIDALCHKHKIQLDRWRYHARWGEGRIGRYPVVLAKPLTFMNLSGQAVKPLLKGLKKGPEDLIVIHDDIDLALGRIKIKSSGGDAGHKGIRSILDELGTDLFLRLRMGVGRPPRGAGVIDYVLSPFFSEEASEVCRAIEMAVSLVEELVRKPAQAHPS